MSFIVEMPESALILNFPARLLHTVNEHAHTQYSGLKFGQVRHRKSCIGAIFASREEGGGLEGKSEGYSPILISPDRQKIAFGFNT